MYVNHHQKLIFLAHPRTASRAVAKALNIWSGFHPVGPHHAGPGGLYEDYRCFTTVRNHWDALASWWWNANGQSPEAVKGKISSAWLLRWWSKNKNYFHLDPEKGVVTKPRLWWFLDSFPPPAILHYETLVDDFHAFLGAYKMSPTRIPVVGLNKFRAGRHYQEVFTPEAAELVQRTFASEIEELGYRY
jgi:hypothetical protein